MSDKKNNTGIDNSGHYNSGDYNSGYYNSGNYNSGDYNSGYYNSGDYNSGHYNSGYSNSGHYNSGHYNSGDYNSGFFNTDEPTVRLFNKDTGLKRSEIDIPYIYLPLTEWKDNKLLTRTYKEAWAKAWSEMDQYTRDKFLNLPNFDTAIFEEITGIKVASDKDTCDGRTVVIDGKKYKLTAIEE